MIFDDSFNDEKSKLNDNTIEDPFEEEKKSQGSHNTIMSQFGKEVKCQICFTEENVLLLQPCWHWALCENCYEGDVTKEDRQKGLTTKDDRCPVCYKVIEETLTQQQAAEMYDAEMKEKKKILRRKTAIRKNKRLLAGAQIQRKLGILGYADDPIYMTLFNVSEKEMGKTFGPTLQEVFQQARFFIGIFLLWLFFAVPSVLVYGLAIQDRYGKKRLAETNWEHVWAMMESLTMSTCYVNTCDQGMGIFIEHFIILDSAFVLFVALLARRNYRFVSDPTKPHLEKKPRAKDDETRRAERTLLLVQCPHLSEPVSQENFQAFFLEFQHYLIRKSKEFAESKGQRRAHLYREDTPPIKECNVTAVVNCSADNVTFAHNAERRFALAQAIEGLEHRVDKAYSITNEWYVAREILYWKEYEIDTLDVRYFDEFFFEEQLGARGRYEEPTNFIFITFETAEQARTARELLHWDKDNFWVHHFKLMFGAPATPFHCVGREGELYSENVDLVKLRYPLWYAQSGWPMRSLLFLGFFLLASNVAGYTLWASSSRGATAALVLVTWQITSKSCVNVLFKFYAHPVRSFARFWVFAAVLFFVYLPSIMLWPVVYATGRKSQDTAWFTAVRDIWWSERQVEMLIATEVAYFGIAFVWGTVGNRLYLFLLRAYRGKAHSQYHLEKKYEPPEWEIALAFLAIARTALVGIAFSAIAPAILVPALLGLITMYIAEKDYLLNFCAIPPRIWDPRANNLMCWLTEGALVTRLLFTSFSLWGIFQQQGPEESQLWQVPQIDVNLPWLVVTCMLALLAFFYSLRVAQVRWVLFMLLTLGDRLCYSCRYDYEMSKQRRAAKWKAEWESRHANGKSNPVSPEKTELSDDEWLAVFDIRFTTKFQTLFESIYRVDDLEHWRPPDRKFTYATRPYESQYDSDKDDSFINLSHLDELENQPDDQIAEQKSS